MEDLSRGTKRQKSSEVEKQAVEEDGNEAQTTPSIVGYNIRNMEALLELSSSQQPGDLPPKELTPQNMGFVQNLVPNYAFPLGSIPSYLYGPTHMTPSVLSQFQLFQQQMLAQEAQISNTRGFARTTPNTLSINSSNSRFVLMEQPSSRQRKSYKNENRYILPNPLTICAREQPPRGDPLPRVIEGTVTVKLIDKDGNELPPEKQTILESVDDKGLTQALAPGLTANFSLKVVETSDGNQFRLLFIVNYVAEGMGPLEEKIQSRPFLVFSNRTKNAKRTPQLQGLKPLRGPASGGTEVWIKGIHFSERVVVTFNGRTADILETADNLLTVTTPAIDPVILDTPVEVEVSNKYQNELWTVEKRLTFIYHPG